MRNALTVLFAALSAFVAGGETEDGLSVAAVTNSAGRSFTTLPFCRRVEGNVSVRKPGGGWTVAEEGRFYPFGTAYRTEKGGTLVVSFGPDCTATIADGAGFETRAQALGTPSRTIVPTGGTIVLKLADNLPEGMFFIATPGFMVRNPAGESHVDYADKGDGDEVVVRCVTGSLAIDGRHFGIAAMRAADEVRIRTTRDHLSTILHGTSGDYIVALDQGTRNRDEFDDEGHVRSVAEKAKLDFRLSPSTRIIINRSLPAIGERMSVHTMTFDSAGTLQNECAFSEGRAEVNSGELVARTKIDGAALVKHAEEATKKAIASAPAGKDGESKEATSSEEGQTNHQQNKKTR